MHQPRDLLGQIDLTFTEGKAIFVVFDRIHGNRANSELKSLQTQSKSSFDGGLTSFQRTGDDKG